MRDLISSYQTFFINRIGRCQTCMRQSLMAALAAWGGLGIGLAIWPDSLVQSLAGLLAIGLSGLWVVHVAVFAARAMAGAPACARAGSDGVNHGRRRALGVLLRAAGAGVAVSVPAVVWSSAALAFCGQCTKNDDCGVGFQCKNTAAVNSGEVCNECVKDS